jgi:DNA invertase Pin-like site-specific DNA recombinase
MKCGLIAYYRVSTQKQGRSGLGLQAQEGAVAAHAASTGCALVASYTEVESGKNSARPELARAMAHAQRAKATLVIAKLDRLSRNVAFIANLMESGVEFVACDNPQANRLTVHILAAVAEQEARAISERTKAALAAYKRRGGSLGTNNLTRRGTLLGAGRAADAHRKAKLDAYTDLLNAPGAARRRSVLRGHREPAQRRRLRDSTRPRMEPIASPARARHRRRLIQHSVRTSRRSCSPLGPVLRVPSGLLRHPQRPGSVRVSRTGADWRVARSSRGAGALRLARVARARACRCRASPDTSPGVSSQCSSHHLQPFPPGATTGASRCSR